MLSTIWNNVLYYPVLNLLVTFYHLLGDNLGLAIILIAVVFRIILIPLTKRQTEMTKKMSTLKPQLDELQKKFANNKEKLAEEQMKLYKKVGYNPLGCLGALIPQLIILSVLIGVIRAVTDNNVDGLYPFIKNWISPNTDLILNTKFLFWDLTKTFNSFSNKGSLEALSYLGIAILVGISQYFSAVFTQKIQNPNKESKKTNKKKNEELTPEEMQMKMMGSMNFILPAMTVFISISAASALSLYWIIQSIMLIVQYSVLDWDKTKEGVQNLITMGKQKKENSKK